MFESPQYLVNVVCSMHVLVEVVVAKSGKGTLHTHIDTARRQPESRNNNVFLCLVCVPCILLFLSALEWPMYVECGIEEHLDLDDDDIIFCMYYAPVKP